ncbi:MAG: hypothetical protein AB1585_09545 [Thermodesulfobacteriota bacterium]
MKKYVIRMIFSLLFVSLLYPAFQAQAQARGQEKLISKIAVAGQSATGREKVPGFPPMAKPGKPIPLPNGGFFIYGFDKTPKLGMVIIKVEIFNKEGKRDLSFEVKADSGMPSMRGAHETGEQPFTLSKKGDYLLPINIVMPGDWEIKLTITKAGKVVFRGSHRFDV